MTDFARLCELEALKIEARNLQHRIEHYSERYPLRVSEDALDDTISKIRALAARAPVQYEYCRMWECGFEVDAKSSAK
jgi:predicted P-loop ATPase